MRIFDLGTRIAPFGDRVGELPLLGRTVEALRSEEVAASRVPPERLSFADYAIATSPVLAAFAKAAPRGAPSALAVSEHSPLAALAPVSSIRRHDGLLIYDIFLDAPAGSELAEVRAGAAPVLVELPVHTRRRELPRIGPPPHALELPDNGVIAAHLEHWVHLVWVAPALVPALLARSTGKRFRSRRAPVASRIGKNVNIHPSAYLEGAVIGDDVEIGASSVVRHSYVGPRSRLFDFTKISWTVLGEDTHTLSDATFVDVVSLGGGTLTSLLLRDSVFGRNVFLTTGVIFWSDSIDGTIHVEHEGRLVDTGRRLLGGCAGHGSILGARTIVAPGRALPNRTTVVMRADEGVTRIPLGAPGEPRFWQEGALVPVRDVIPNARPEEMEPD